MSKILVVDDEPGYLETVAYVLRKEGFKVFATTSGVKAVQEFRTHGADLVLLDLMMPDMSGREVMTKLRAATNVPVIVVSALDSELDAVVSLDMGADDYVTKPFPHRELAARIRAVLRRCAQPEPEREVMDVMGVRMDVERHHVQVDGKSVQLALREFAVLELLMRDAGKVLSRLQIIKDVWGSDYVGDTKTLDVHVKRLRNKIEINPASPKRIITVRGVGYLFASSAD